MAEEASTGSDFAALSANGYQIVTACGGEGKWTSPI